MKNDIFNPIRVTATLQDKEYCFETGRVANQADGAVWIQCGGTVVLVTVCSQTLESSKGFFPLTVEYAERMYAAGRIPGSFFRREIGRPSERETLVSRLIDRPIRPLFPKGLMQDVQVLATVLSADAENDPDILAMTGASAAIHLSSLPFDGPVVGARVGRINGQFVLNPTISQRKISDLELVFAASSSALTMVEGEAKFVPEDILIDALERHHATIGCAESCSGGMASMLLTQRAGSSAFMMGSVTSYDPSVKEGILGVDHGIIREHGTVSAECAVAMADGARKAIGSDFAFSITGVAGPDKSEGKDVGTVFIGFSGKGRETEAAALKFTSWGRDSVRKRSSVAAFLLMAAFIDGRSPAGIASCWRYL